ncbi:MULTISPECIES: hypothetical protein [Bacteroides]|uniref:hypothetical protein n=1 Tax=Bacteroides TaxID=816 RepID=UPI001CA93BE4|nr:hypothetical protein [Bacteroides fragilis]MBY2899766.1 hypothetical protein [Bacteroides fragilis]MCM0327329.1 hypothetical protein [Bacteroides fragilis]
MGNFENYKILKKKLDISYKGIYLNRVLAVHIWNLVNDKCSFCFSLKHFFLLFLSINVRKMVFDPKQHSILSTFGRYCRKDHLQLYESIINRLEGKASYNNTLEFGWKISIHPLVGMKMVSKVFRCLKEDKIRFREKLALSVLVVHYCNVIEELCQMNFSNVEKYLSMCSVLDLENLLTQYMKGQGIPSYSLQEGIYFIYKTNSPLDSIQYENFEAQYLMCWGQFSVDEYVSFGISPERLYIAGYPKKIDVKLMKKDNPFKKCMVLLARESFRETNKKLLDILIELSSQYAFCLKLHPSCNYLYYSQYVSLYNINVISKDKMVEECLNNKEYDFCIAVNTTAYYEVLMRGLPCLRFFDGTFDLMAGYNDVFQTKEDFEKYICDIKHLSIFDYQADINKILEYAIGVGIDKYKEILCL